MTPPRPIGRAKLIGAARIVRSVPDVALTHNPLNGVTGGVWRRGGVVHKILTRRPEAPPHWAASDDPRHWNYWKREALVYRTGLPDRLGLGAPDVIGITESADGDIELRLEHVEGAHGAQLGIEDLEVTARDLGRAQGAAHLPADDWLSRHFLRDYGGSRLVHWALIDDDAAWSHPLIREHFAPALRQRLVELHRQRDRLLATIERLPRTVCHLDVWPNNLIRRPGGEIVFVDWAFVGDGALGEDVGNLVPDSVLDLLFPHDLLDELDARVTAAYLDGLRDAGWRGDARAVRLGICASAVKYDWLTAYCLEHASADRQPAYGHQGTVDANARYAARAAALALCARWMQEADELAG